MSFLLKEYKELLDRAGLLVSAGDRSRDETPVLQMTYNSKEAVEGTLFICKGAAFKKAYLEEAHASGAFACVSETDYRIPGMPVLLVTDIRRAMPLLAEKFFAIPDNALQLIGVTGTKGKTTTCYFLRKIFSDHAAEKGKKAPAFITSVETYDGTDTRPSVNTTPEVLEGYRYLRHACDNGIDTVIMEVSSQGLKYDRVGRMRFRTGMILNLSPDHISPIEHPDLEDYYSAKLKLFSQSDNAVVNLDSDHADLILRAAILSGGVYTYGTRPGADYRITEISEEDGHVSFFIEGEGRCVPFELGMRGMFNAENAAAAIVTGRIHGIPFETMQAALKDLTIPGRDLEYHSSDDRIAVIVDYAHNELSCRKVIETARHAWPDREIITVFGCTGGKALNRREGMGKTISALSDRIYLTEDDPGPEEVGEICREVAGYFEHDRYRIIPDRAEAIRAAFAEAEAPSVILVLGKGGETAQKRGRESVPYLSDPVVVEQCMEAYNSQNGEKTKTETDL